MENFSLRGSHRSAVSVVLAITLAGCATVRNTPAQDYVWEMGRKCNAAGITMTHVDPDGRYHLHGANTTSFSAFTDCMQEKQREQPFQAWLAKNSGNAATSTVTAPPPVVMAVSPVPLWKLGDEWSYRWTSPQGAGTFVWSVTREEVLEGVAYYVVKSGMTREIYFRKNDLAYYMDNVDGRAETKHVPPSTPVRWPLTVGDTWELRYTRERPMDRQAEDKVFRCESAVTESVTVPAGTYDTVKVICRDVRTGQVTLELWPSPAVKQAVRERMYLPDGGVRERELIGVKLGR